MEKGIWLCSLNCQVTYLMAKTIHSENLYGTFSSSLKIYSKDYVQVM